MSSLHQYTSTAAFLLAAALAGGCGEGEGTYQVRVFGEDFIETGIPAAEVSDGWAVTFQRFLISVRDVRLAKGHGAPAVNDAAIRVYDLTRPSQGAGAAVLSQSVANDSYDHFGYRIGPAAAGAVAGNELPAGALAALTSAGESVRVAGTASKAGKTITFDWGFTSNTNHSCHKTVKIDGGAAKNEITVHGDHLFYDDLVAEEPNLAFDLIAAADADNDGAVDKTELAARDITREARYQVGNNPVTNLWAFIAHQVTTLGHVDGEGHCEATVE